MFEREETSQTPAVLVVGVLVIVSFALVLRAIWGFGDSMVAVPLLAGLIGLEQATPLMVLLSAVMAVALLREKPELIERATIARMMVGAVVGVPIGVHALVQLEPIWAHGVLGVLLLGFGLGSLLFAAKQAHAGEPASPPQRGGWALDLGFGLIAGATSSAFDIVGPPMIVYATIRGWQPDELRVNLQAMFLPLALLAASGHAISDLWTDQVMFLALVSLPIVALVLVVGPRLRGRLAGDRRLVYGLITVLGLGELVATFVRSA